MPVPNASDDWASAEQTGGMDCSALELGVPRSFSLRRTTSGESKAALQFRSSTVSWRSWIDKRNAEGYAAPHLEALR